MRGREYMKRKLMFGDCLERMKEIPDNSIDLVVTSPPYGIGKEYESWNSFDEYLDFLNEVICEMAKTLKPDGVMAIQTGYYIGKGFVEPLDFHVHDFIAGCDWLGDFMLKNRIIWTYGYGLHCKNRFSGRHEVVHIYSRSQKPTFNLDAVRVPQKYPNKKHYKGLKKGQLSGNPLGKNPSDVWNITNVKNNHPEKTSHPCQFPEELSKRLVLVYTNKNDMVMDPFMGSGTVGAVCKNLKRNFIGIEKDREYFKIAKQRIEDA